MGSQDSDKKLFTLKNTSLLGSVLFLYSQIVYHYWHKTWFEAIGIPYNMVWFSSKTSIFTLTNIVYILFFLFGNLLIIALYYLFIRGLLSLMKSIKKFVELRSIEYLKVKYVWFVVVSYIIGFIILFILPSYITKTRYSDWILLFVFFTLSLMALHPNLDLFFRKLRKDLLHEKNSVYEKKDMLSFIPLAVLLYIFIDNNIFNNYLFISTLFTIFVLSPMLMPENTGRKPQKVIVLIVCSFAVVVLPVVTIADVAKKDAEYTLKMVLNGKCDEKIYDFPLDGVISHKSIVRGDIYVDNIEAVPVNNINRNFPNQNLLKNIWFISLGETTILLKPVNGELKVLFVKNGRFLKAFSASSK